ncbi:metalloendopeptidase, partial [Mycoemilia scoparia]
MELESLETLSQLNLTGKDIMNLSAILDLLRQKDTKISLTSPTTATFENIIVPYERVTHQFTKIVALVSLLYRVSDDMNARDACKYIFGKYSSYWKKRNSDPKFKRLFQTLRDTPETYESLTKDEAQVLEDIISIHDSFSPPKNSSSSDIENKLQELRTKWREKELEFMDNIKLDYPEEVEYTLNELRGLPEEFLKSREIKNQKLPIILARDQKPVILPQRYVLFVNDRDYDMVMNNAKSSRTRKGFHQLYQQRFPENCNLLLDILNIKQEIAKILGFKNYFEYTQHHSGISPSEKFMKQISQLKREVGDIAKWEIEDLIDFKRLYKCKKRSKRIIDPEIYAWDEAFFRNLIENSDTKQTSNTIVEEISMMPKDNSNQRHYDDDDGLTDPKEFGFMLESVMQGSFGLFYELFGLEFNRNMQAQPWHPDVLVYNVFNTSIATATDQPKSQVGTVYFDLYKRPGKVNEKFSIVMDPNPTKLNTTSVNSNESSASATDGSSIALCFNFTKPETKCSDGDAEVVITHKEVIEYFQQFGAIIQTLLVRFNYPTQANKILSGTSIGIETISKVFRYFAFDPYVLQKLAPLKSHQDIHGLIQKQKSVMLRSQRVQGIILECFERSVHQLSNPNISKLSLIQKAIYEEAKRLKED